jgi:hypothetical protein
MRGISLARFAPLTGVVFVPLLVGAQVLEGSPPDVDAPTSNVVRFWTEHDTEMRISAILGGLAAFFLVWFAGSLRAALRRVEREPGRVSAIAFAGFVMFALGGAMFDGFKLVAADTAGDVPGAMTQTLFALQQDFFLPFMVGFVLAFLASATAIPRHGLLPRWLGYVAIPIPFLLLTPAGLVAFVAGAIWILIVSVLLFLREGRPVQPSKGSRMPA